MPNNEKVNGANNRSPKTNGKGAISAIRAIVKSAKNRNGKTNGKGAVVVKGSNNTNGANVVKGSNSANIKAPNANNNKKNNKKGLLKTVTNATKKAYNSFTSFFGILEKNNTGKNSKTS